MNVSADSLQDQEVGGDVVRQRAAKGPKHFGTRPKKFGRTYGKGPSQHNGMHRRRRKKVQW